MVRRKNTARSRTSRTTSSERSETRVLVRNKKGGVYVRALQEIKRLRKTVHLLIPTAPFLRLVREIIIDLFPHAGTYRISSTALEALQEATEAYVTQFFEDCMLLVIHAKRKTLMRQDMILMRRLRGRTDIINK